MREKKRSGSFSLLTSVILALLLCGGPIMLDLVTEAEAGRSRSSKRSSWGRSKSSSRSYSKPSRSNRKKSSSAGYKKPHRPRSKKVASSGYKKPTMARNSQPTSVGTKKKTFNSPVKSTARRVDNKPGSTSAARSGGYAKPTVTTKTSRPRKQSTLDRKIARKQAADAFKARKTKLEKQRTEQIRQTRQSRLYQETTGNHRYQADDIQRSRRDYYNRMGSYPRRYHGSRLFDQDRNYGGLDNGFLMTMLFANMANKEMGSSMLWYGLTGNPAVSLFLADTKKQAHETNDSELLRRIRRLERNNARLRSEKVTRPSVAESLKQHQIPPQVALQKGVLTGKVQRSGVVRTHPQG